jgi:hypothetical protein
MRLLSAVVLACSAAIACGPVKEEQHVVDTTIRGDSNAPQEVISDEINESMSIPADLNVAAAAEEQDEASWDDGYASLSAQQKRLFDEYMRLNSDCRGGAGDAATTELACQKRDAAGDAMFAAGVCYGRQTDESAAEAKPHICAADSLGMEGNGSGI